MKDHPDLPLPKVLRGNCNCGDFTTMAGADSRCFYCKAAEEIEELESVISRQYEYSKAKSAEIEQKTFALEHIRKWAMAYQQPDGTFDNEMQTPFLLADRALYPETTKDAEGLPCCGSESGVHLIGCQSPDASRIHRPASEQDTKPDVSTCPRCGGPADNGHDRCFPPNPYACTKCEQLEKVSGND